MKNPETSVVAQFRNAESVSIPLRHNDKTIRTQYGRESGVNAVGLRNKTENDKRFKYCLNIVPGTAHYSCRS